jgi:hypothetical protein
MNKQKQKNTTKWQIANGKQQEETEIANLNKDIEARNGNTRIANRKQEEE